MLSSSGKTIRLGRLMDPQTRRGVIIAYSHSLILGPQPGTTTEEEIERTLDACSDANGIMVPPGFVDRHAWAFAGSRRPSLVVHLDWTNFSQKVFARPTGAQVEVASIENVAAVGADAVMTYLLLGYDDPERDAAEIERNSRIARACDALGIPLIIEPRYAQEREHPELKTDRQVMQYYCRVASDLGADIIKCVWPGDADAMHALAASCPSPLYVAGGARDAENPEQIFRMAEDAVGAGARGLIVGRNIYQASDPRSALRRVMDIVGAGTSD